MFDLFGCATYIQSLFSFSLSCFLFASCMSIVVMVLVLFALVGGVLCCVLLYFDGFVELFIGVAGNVFFHVISVFYYVLSSCRAYFFVLLRWIYG